MAKNKEIIIFFILFLISSQPGISQEEQVYQYKAEVLLVEMQVSVFDKEGNFVEGLKPEDFIIIDKGQEQKISHFDYIVHNRQNIDLISRGSPALKRNFMLLFDFSFASTKGILRSRKAGLDFLDMILPTDKVAVTTFSTLEGLKPVVNFTNDKRQLKEAISTLGLIKTPNLIYDNLHYSFKDIYAATAVYREKKGEFDEVIAEIDGEFITDVKVREPELVEMLMLLKKRIAAQTYELQVVDFIAQIQSLGDAFKAIKGKKNIIYFSHGFDSNMLQTRVGVLTGGASLRFKMDDMLQRFVGADCAIQSIDIGGLREDKKLGEEILFFMANKTGGKFYKARTDLTKPLEDILQSTSKYYVMGYYPKDLGMKGKYRKINVKVNRPDLKVVTRKGYYEDKPFKDYSELEKKIRLSEVIINDVIHNDIQFDALVSVFPSEGIIAKVPVFLQFPGKQFLLKERKKSANLEIYGYLMDDKGTFKDFFSVEVPLDIKNSKKTLESRGLRFYDMLLTTPGKHKVKLIVQDSDTGELGSRIFYITATKYDSKALAISAPLFIETDRKWLFSRGYDPKNPEGKKKGLPISYPFTFGKKEYIPSVVTELKAGQSAKFCLNIYNLTIHPETKKPKTNMKFEIIYPEGNAYMVQEISLVNKPSKWEDECLEFMFQFMLDKFPPGEYQLKVTFADILARQFVESSTPFILKP